MTAEELFKTLEDKDVSVRCKNGKLRIEAPVGVLTHAVLAQLGHRKDEILALIRRRSQVEPLEPEVANLEPDTQAQTMEQLEANLEALLAELGQVPGKGMEFARPGHPAHETYLRFCELERQWMISVGH